MVYVDNFYVTGGGNFGRMKMSHLIADTTEELLEMVDRIGVQRKWIQHKGTLGEHFDIAIVKRRLAITHGAKEINFREYGQMIEKRCADAGVHWTLAHKTKRSTT
jgi:hypothetical protein